MTRHQAMLGGTAMVVGSILCYFFPLFHVEPLEDKSAATGSTSSKSTSTTGVVSPGKFVQEFWESSQRIGEGVTSMVQLHTALASDASAAKQQFGKQVGLGGAWYFLVRGEGTVASVEKTRCTLDIQDSDHHVEISLGVIFGNTVREAIGIDVNHFANSQDFNALSTELNRRVEQEVIEAIRPVLQVGQTLQFVGCAKVARDSDFDPLRIVPIHLAVASNSSGSPSSEAAQSGPSP